MVALASDTGNLNNFPERMLPFKWKDYKPGDQGNPFQNSLKQVKGSALEGHKIRTADAPSVQPEGKAFVVFAGRF
jgi:hypothetical protein